MWNQALLKEEVEDFLRKNLQKDLPSLLLKGSPFPEISIQELGTQLNGLQIARKKFPELFQTSGILYPPKLNLEQTSSEVTAKYKAELVSGKNAIDMTGGMGIDSYFLSKQFQQFDYCEINSELAQLAAHNFKTLQTPIEVHTENGLHFLAETAETYDWIYTDPARRDEHGGKVFRFSDCTPDIPANLELLFQRTNNILIKSSPMMDISAGIKELDSVAEVHIVAVENEVKELLWILHKNLAEKPKIKTINFEKKAVQSFEASSSEVWEMEFSAPQTYLFEPNAAIQKSGLFAELAHQTQTKKLHPNSHIFTSEDIIDFPGRKFQIIDSMAFNNNDLKKKLKGVKANVTTRNFPESVENIRKKFKIKEGGKTYLFFTTGPGEQKLVIFCEKLNDDLKN